MSISKLQKIKENTNQVLMYSMKHELKNKYKKIKINFSKNEKKKFKK